MRKWVWVLAMLLVVGACARPTIPKGEDKVYYDEARAFVNEYLAAYGSHDKSRILALYAPEAKIDLWRGQSQGLKTYTKNEFAKALDDSLRFWKETKTKYVLDSVRKVEKATAFGAEVSFGFTSLYYPKGEEDQKKDQARDLVLVRQSGHWKIVDEYILMMGLRQRKW